MLDETCRIDRFAEIKFSSNTLVQHVHLSYIHQTQQEKLDEMLDQLNSALRYS